MPRSVRRSRTSAQSMNPTATSGGHRRVEVQESRPRDVLADDASRARANDVARDVDGDGAADERRVRLVGAKSDHGPGAHRRERAGETLRAEKAHEPRRVARGCPRLEKYRKRDV